MLQTKTFPQIVFLFFISLSTANIGLSICSTVKNQYTFSDDYFYNLIIMAVEPSKKKTRRNWSTETEDETTTIEVSVLQSINHKISKLEVLYANLKELKHSLEFAQFQIDMLQKENSKLKDTKLSLPKPVILQTKTKH